MPSGRFRFGLFELDAESLELRRAGTIVHLQRQPTQVLLCLVKNADRTVSREELRKAVWSDQTFVDFERGLNFCISQIRSALSDDSTRPTYIPTVAKQGYQFIAPVQCGGSTSLPDPKATTIASTLSHRRVFLAGMALLVSTAIGLAYYLMQVRHVPKQLPVVAVVRFDNETSDPAMVRFSDDLTDTFVERLTSLSSGNYAVIGNARILRGSRNGRDLKAIAVNLRADYVVLGQVQAYQGQTRILVHLIHLPEQTHVSVARMDRPLTNPLDLEREAAQRIAVDFSQRLTSAAHVPSPVSTSQ